MKLTVIHKGGARYDIASGTHTLVTDQPVEDGGGDAGMSPVEALRRLSGELRCILRGAILRAASDPVGGVHGGR